MNYKLEYLANDELQTFYLNKKNIILGKLSKNDLQINDTTVSRNHCKFIKTKNSYKIIDLNSTNGTFVNGKIINEKILNVGDNIAIGKTILKFLAASEKENYYESDDQKISMIIPLSEELKVEKGEKKETNKLNLLTSLTELGKNLIASSTLEETFEKVGQLIFELLNPKRLFIFSYDSNHKQLLLKYSQVIGKNKSEKVNISKTIAMKAIKEKIAILSANTKNDTRFNGAKSIILYGITSALSIPIWTKNSIYGLIYADATDFEQIFKEKDLEILSILANFTGLSIESINRLNNLNKEKKLRSRLARYHSPSVVSRIMECQNKNTHELMNYKESEATVLFMDIVNFTSKAESMAPIEVGQFLNNIFTEMTDIIFKYNGTLDKYIGDAIMAVFGIPFKYDNHAELSILTAIDMQKKLLKINLNLPKKDKIRIRIGINSGKLISGDFGSPKRFDYTVLGNTVNIASRLESIAAKPDEIVVSERTYNLTKDLFEFEYLGKKKMHGISKGIKSYKVIKKKGVE